jgi:hypothetical protein
MRRLRGALRVAALVLVAGVILTGAAAPAASAAPDAAQLDAFLAAHASPLTGTGDMFVVQGQTSGVDPAFLVAIAGAETSFGRLLYVKDGDVAAFNAFNWFYGPTWPQSDFASWDEAIARVASGLAGGLYHGAGLYSVGDIAPRYCPDGTAAWVANVTAFLMELGGDPTDTRLTASYGPPVTQPGLVELQGEMSVGVRRRRVGEMVSARFTVTNKGGQALQVDGITLAVRCSSGSAVDLVSRSPVSLSAGESRAVLARWRLDQAGDWSGWIEVEQQGSVSLVGEVEAFAFSVRLPRGLEMRRWDLRERGLHVE